MKTPPTWESLSKDVQDEFLLGGKIKLLDEARKQLYESSLSYRNKL